MSRAPAATGENLDLMTWVAQRELYPSVEQQATQLLALLPQLIDADRVEVSAARTVPDSFFQVAAIFAQIEMQGQQLVVEVLRLTEIVRGRLATLAGSAEVPHRMVGLGQTWREQVARLDTMIATAQRLADQPDWKGRASEAHLAVLPRQIEAMLQLRGLAETAAESVLLVGALQNNIFDACALIFSEAIEQLRGQTSSAPTAFYSRCAACITLLTRVDALLTQWISGEGTWRPSASQIAEGLTETSGTGFEWPKAVSGSATPGAGKDTTDTKPGGDGNWKSTVSAEGITVTTQPGQETPAEPVEPTGPDDAPEEPGGVPVEPEAAAVEPEAAPEEPGEVPEELGEVPEEPEVAPEAAGSEPSAPEPVAPVVDVDSAAGGPEASLPAVEEPGADAPEQSGEQPTEEPATDPGVGPDPEPEIEESGEGSEEAVDAARDDIDRGSQAWDLLAAGGGQG